MMKNKRRIIIVTISVVATLLVLVTSRHAIISKMLQYVIETKSDGKIILNPGKLYMDLKSWDIIITSPKLHFKNMYVLEKDSLLINEMDFNKLIIKGLSFTKLFFQQSFICNQLLIDKPSAELNYILKKNRKWKKTPTFDPFLLIKILKSRSFGKTDLVLKINRTDIRFGSVNLLESKAVNSTGSAIYTVKLRGLRTGKVYENIKNELTYDKLTAEIGNLNYFFPIQGYQLHIDTAYYNSTLKQMDISGLILHKKIELNRPGIIDFNAGKINIKGIVLDNTDSMNLKRLNLQSLKLENDTITYVLPVGIGKNKKDKKVLKMLFKLFPKINFDTISIKKTTLRLLKKSSDSVAVFEDIQMLTNKVKFDSSIIKYPFKNFSFKNFSFSCKKFIFFTKKFTVSGQRIFFSEKPKTFIINKLNLITKKINSINLSIPHTEINGVSFHKLQKLKLQHIVVKLKAPQLVIKQDSCGSKVKTEVNYIGYYNKYFALDKIEAVKGLLKIQDDRATKMAAKNINLMLTNFKFTPLSNNPPHIEYKHVKAEIDKISITNSINNISATGKNIQFNDKIFSIDSVKILNKANSYSQNIAIAHLFSKKKKLCINDLIFNNKINLLSVTFKKSAIYLTIINNKKAFKSNIKFHYFIKSLLAENGILNIKRIFHGDTLQLNTNFSLYSSNIANYQSANLFYVFGGKWQLQLNNFMTSNIAGKIKFEKANINSETGLTSVKKIYIYQKDINHEFVTAIPNVEFKNINYSRLNRDTISFDKATIRGDSLFIANHLQNNVKKSENFNIRVPFHFLFDTIQLRYKRVTFFKTSTDNFTTFLANNLNIAYFNHLTLLNHDTLNLFNKADFLVQSFTITSSKEDFTIFGQNISNFNTEKSLTIDTIWAIKNTRNTYSRRWWPPAKMMFSLKNIIITKPEFNLMTNSFSAHLLTMQKIKVNISGKRSAFSTRKKSSLKNEIILPAINFSVDSTICKSFNIYYILDTQHKIEANNIRLLINNINITSTASFTQAPYFFNNFSLDLRHNTITSVDSMYKFRLKSFNVNLPMHKFKIDTLSILPIFDDSIFFKKSVFQTDRIRFITDNIVVNNIDIDKLIKSGFINVGNVKLSGTDINIMRDKRFPLKPNIYKKMPLEILTSLKTPFFIDSIQIHHAHITYAEIAKKSSRPGVVHFSDINSTWYNITNKTGLFTKAMTLKIILNGKLFNETPFQTHIFIPYFNNNNNVFQFDASSGEINMQKLNSITQNLMGISIHSGAGNVNIPLINGNENFAKGEMIFKYNRLKFGLYNRKKAEAYKGIANPFINFVLNKIMIRSNNPRLFGRTQTGFVYFERNRQKTFINFLWKSILSGALSTMGFNTKQQRLEKKEFKKATK